MPHRLETRNGEQLVHWIGDIVATTSAANSRHATQYVTLRGRDVTCDRCRSITICNGRRFVCPNCGNSMKFRWLPNLD
jgi:hypothetical protein